MAEISEENHTPTSEHDVETSNPVTEGSDAGASEPSQEESSEKESQAEEELEVYKNKYLRLAAEFENYKRRAQRDQSDAIRYANESLLKNLLATIDNLERAIQCAKDEGTTGALLEGIELTHKQFLETVGKLGVRQISSPGNVFDPSMHQAVAHVESDTAPPNTVVEEFQKGYFLHDRILRPAMVTVAKEKSDPTEPSSVQDAGKEGGIEA